MKIHNEKNKHFLMSPSRIIPCIALLFMAFSLDGWSTKGWSLEEDHWKSIGMCRSNQIICIMHLPADGKIISINNNSPIIANVIGPENAKEDVHNWRINKGSNDGVVVGMTFVTGGTASPRVDRVLNLTVISVEENRSLVKVENWRKIYEDAYQHYITLMIEKLDTAWDNDPKNLKEWPTKFIGGPILPHPEYPSMLYVYSIDGSGDIEIMSFIGFGSDDNISEARWSGNNLLVTLHPTRHNPGEVRLYTSPTRYTQIAILPR